MPNWEQLTFDSLIVEDSKLGAVFEDALETVVKKKPRPPVEASFYPYAGLSSTIRLRKGRVYVRVSDILRQSPREVLFALACILVAKLYRQKTSAEHERTYREFTTNPALVGATEATRRNRGYKLITSPRGRVYDLDALFSDLNRRYFEDQLARPLLSWSQQETGRVLGHHDHVHGAIVISRTLDSPQIPRLVMEYVLYHEMLHVKHPPRVGGGRTIYHSREFHSEERRFERFEEAVSMLDGLARPRPRRRPHRRPR